jgi:Tfp pilus assembly protein PilP
MKKAIIFLMFCLLLFVFTGCNKDQPEKKSMAEKVRQTDVKKDRKPPEGAKKVEQEEVIYDAKGKKDPFLSLVELTKQKAVKKRGATPFESYDVEEVKILAIAWAKDKYYALIRLPDTKNYTITEGMAMGLQGGKVEKITKEMVVIREYVKDYKGDIKPRDAILKLHKGEEE